jgi:transcriptional regulator with XRE-family HTH domain
MTTSKSAKQVQDKDVSRLPNLLIGAEVGRLRTSKGLSRQQLFTRVYRHLDNDDPILEVINESWLKRVETGEVVNLTRRMLEVLCQGLDCTEKQKARLLLYADRSVLVKDGEKPDRATEVLNYVMQQAYTGAHEILLNNLGDHRMEDLDEQEVIELAIKALTLAMKQRQRRHSPDR